MPTKKKLTGHRRPKVFVVSAKRVAVAAGLEDPNARGEKKKKERKRARPRRVRM